MRLILSLFFVGLLNGAKSTRCESILLERCSCGYTRYDRDLYYVVNCTDTNFKSTEMLESLPSATQVLIFTGNNIPELPWNVFGELDNLPNLTIIDMSNNNIREIKGKSYHHVPNVRRLILNHNNLTIADQEDFKYHHKRVFSNFVNLLELHLTDAFADNTDSALANDLHDIFVNSNLSLLNKLHLEQNEIRNFRDVNVFCDLPSIKDLYLGDNYLTGLAFNVSCLKQIRFLDLERNNISSFSKKDLKQLEKLSFSYRHMSLIIDIGSNPFNCDENRNLYDWMKSTNVTIRNKELLECRQVKNGKIHTVNLKHMFDEKVSYLSHVRKILLLTLTIIFILILIAYAYVSKEKLLQLRPTFDVISRKVHYTTIESQQNV